MSRLFVSGGCGFIGSALVPELLRLKHEVVVMDLQWFGNSLLDDDDLLVVKEDIRDIDAINHYVQGCDAFIHLACISNDVSLELNPALGKSINLDCFPHIVKSARDAGVQRFIYASSSSVYGVKTEEKVTEDLSLEPMTDYARFKAECEPLLLDENSNVFCTTVVRPGAVCGYAPRLRLDLVVNMLTAQAYFNKKITVFGGEQLRSHIHIDDMVRAYIELLDAPFEKINGQIFNVSGENMSVIKLATLLQRESGKPIETRPTDDLRSYHVCSDKIFEAIGFRTEKNVEDAIDDLIKAFPNIDDPFSSQYVNIKRMKELGVA